MLAFLMFKGTVSQDRGRIKRWTKWTKNQKRTQYCNPTFYFFNAYITQRMYKCLISFFVLVHVDQYKNPFYSSDLFLYKMFRLPPVLHVSIIFTAKPMFSVIWNMEALEPYMFGIKNNTVKKFEQWNFRSKINNLF